MDRNIRKTYKTLPAFAAGILTGLAATVFNEYLGAIVDDRIAPPSRYVDQALTYFGTYHGSEGKSTNQPLMYQRVVRAVLNKEPCP